MKYIWHFLSQKTSFETVCGGVDWFDRTSTADDPFYVLKLICSVIIDTPNNVFSFLEGNIVVLNGAN